MAPYDQLLADVTAFIAEMPDEAQELIERCHHKLTSIVEAYDQYGLMALTLLTAQKGEEANKVLLQVADHAEARAQGDGAWFTVEHKEIHNVWTLYGMNPDGTEAKDKLLSMSTRPQDWGDPRWSYHHYLFRDFTTPSGFSQCTFHCHCWTDLKRSDGEYRTLFAAAFAYIHLPGTAVQLCGREFLGVDDFWDKEWGERPPIFEEEHDLDEFGDLE